VDDDRVHILKPPSSDGAASSSLATTAESDYFDNDVAAVSAGVVTLSLAVRQLRGAGAGDVRVASPVTLKKTKSRSDNYAIKEKAVTDTLEIPSITLLSAELMLFDSIGNMFNAQEIFGLGSSSTATTTGDDAVATGDYVMNAAKEVGEQAMQAVSSMASAVADAFGGGSGGSPSNRAVSDANPTAAAAADAEQGSGAATSPAAPITCSNGAVVGGRYTEEECVVCMCEPKSVVLLPCR
jgi:hypothetical protein